MLFLVIYVYKSIQLYLYIPPKRLYISGPSWKLFISYTKMTIKDVPCRSLCIPLHFLWTKSTHRRRSQMIRRTEARSATWHHNSLSANTRHLDHGRWPSLRPKSPLGYRQSTDRWAWSWLWCWTAGCKDTYPPHVRCRSRCWHFPSIGT